MRWRLWHRSPVWVLFGIVGQTLIPFAWSAEVWQAPTLVLLNDPYLVLVARAMDVGPQGEVAWQLVETIRGETATRFSTATRGERSVEVEPGEEYVIAVTDYRRHPSFREGLEMAPEGRSVVELPGLGPALFPNLPVLKRILQSAQGGIVDAAGYVSDLQQLMESDLSSVRRLALTELYLRPNLWLWADQTTVSCLRQILVERDPDESESELVLAVGQGLAATQEVDWLGGESRRIIAEAPQELHLASYYPALVERSLLIVATAGDAADVGQVLRHLDSNSPGVVKAAIAALTVLDCPAGVRAAGRILDRSESLHREIRQSLEAWVIAGCDGT